MLAVLDKELRDIIKNRLLLFSVLLPPLIFALLPVGMLFAARSDPMRPEELEPLIRLQPALAGLDPVAATEVLLISQFTVFFLAIPAMLPMVIASFSIIGEKQARSLEPLLATPISVWELLLGKCLGAVLPAIAATWLGYLFAMTGILILGTPLTRETIMGPVWLLSMLLLAPLISVVAVGLGVIISSRVNDTRVAQQAAGLLVMPLIGVFVGQFAGIVLVSIPLVLAAAVALVAVDAVVMWFAVLVFRRERILTEWR